MSILADCIGRLPHLRQLQGTDNVGEDTLFFDRERMPALTRVLVIVDEEGDGVRVWVIGKVTKGVISTSPNPVNVVLANIFAHKKWEERVKDLFEMYRADKILGLTPEIRMGLFRHNLVSLTPYDAIRHRRRITQRGITPMYEVRYAH